MYIRCPDCRTSTWAAGPDGGVLPTVACKGCGAGFELDATDLGDTAAERHGKAVAFADREGVDLATAYSTLLGLIQVAASPDRAMADDNAEADATDRPPADEVGYDPGFRKAVAEGRLTAEQAREIGDRDSAASRLAQRHGLTEDLAKQVLDRRLALSEAIRIAPPRPAPKPVVKPADPRQKAMIAGMALAIVAALIVFAINRWSAIEADTRAAESRAASIENTVEDSGTHEAAGPAPVATPAVQRHPDKPIVVADDEGRLLKVTARTPTAVLYAFCSAAETAGRYSADRVIPGARGSRLGVVRAFGEMDQRLAILIRRDRNDRWVAGNGIDPIVVADLPEQSVPQTARLP